MSQNTEAANLITQLVVLLSEENLCNDANSLKKLFQQTIDQVTLTKHWPAVQEVLNCISFQKNTSTDRFVLSRNCLEKNTRKLARHKSEEQIAEFLSLCKKLEATKTIGDITNCIEFLCRLSHPVEPTTTTTIISSGIELARAGSSTFLPIPSSTPTNPLAQNLTGFSGLSQLTTIAPLSTETSLGLGGHFLFHSQQQQQQYQRKQPSGSFSPDPITARSRDDQPKPSHLLSNQLETALLTDLLYVMHGLNGRFLHYNWKTKEFQLDETSLRNPSGQLVGLAEPNRELFLRHRGHNEIILKLASCGFQYRRIADYNNCRLANPQLPNKTSNGFIAQSIAAGLHQLLQEYLRVLAVLQTLLSSQSADHSNVHLVSCSSPPAAAAVTTEQKPLTLVSLYKMMFEWKIRLNLAVEMVEGCRWTKGGQSLSELYKMSTSGDATSAGLVNKVLLLAGRPFYQMLIGWLFHGQLNDPYEEFFVRKRPAVGASLWHETYRLDQTMIPEFISGEQAKKIFLTGKSADFIRHVLTTQRRPQMISLKSRLLDPISSILNEPTKRIEQMWHQNTTDSFQFLLDTVHGSMGQLLLELLRQDYQLDVHLDGGCYQLLLMGQGDFIQALIEAVHQYLDMPANQIDAIKLEPSLTTAIHTSNALLLPELVRNRIQVGGQAFSSSTGAVVDGVRGWEVFSLMYVTGSNRSGAVSAARTAVNTPLNTVLTQSVMKRYEKIFNSIWIVKGAEWKLIKSWRQLSTSWRLLWNGRLARTYPQLSMGRQHVQRALRLNNFMSSIVNQLVYYLQMEVVERSWLLFRQKCLSVKDLDDLLHEHDQFLKTIERSAFLHQPTSELKRIVSNLCRICCNHSRTTAVFVDAIETEVIRHRQYLHTMTKTTTTTTTTGKSRLTAEQRNELDVEDELARADFVKTILPTFTVQLNANQLDWMTTIGANDSWDSADDRLDKGLLPVLVSLSADGWVKALRDRIRFNWRFWRKPLVL